MKKEEYRQPVASSGAAGLAASRTGILAVALTVASCLASPAWSQGSDARVPVQDTSQPEDTTALRFKSTSDSVAWERSRTMAAKGTGLRVLVSLRERQVLVMRGADTLRSAAAAVASGMTIEHAGRSWTFRTPRGRHTVLRKMADPVWSPPDWLYAEAAIAHDLELARLSPDRPVRVNGGEMLTVRRERVGLLNASGQFRPLPTNEHIVFNGTLYIPPFPTQNRRVEGELGRFALDLGDGYLIHGTTDPKSIGRAVTHGCIRLGDDDIDWLYRNVPVGTTVVIY